ncbi:hypothetical protein EV715DRAFT_288546 [Schizophyllum commune]
MHGGRTRLSNAPRVAPSQDLPPPPQAPSGTHTDSGRWSDASPDIGCCGEIPPEPEDPPRQYARFTFHEGLNGHICDHQGHDLPEGTPPPVQQYDDTDYTPFKNRAHFHLADFTYRDAALGKRKISTLMQIWAVYNAYRGDEPPFRSYQDVEDTIDAIPYGDLRWKSFAASYNGAPVAGDAPSWMSAEYDVWYRDPRAVIESILGNPEFAKDFDYVPYQEFTKGDHRRWKEMMSGDWAWREADTIIHELRDAARGAFLIPVILGSDKTTVSVATGNNEYYPLYLSIGNLHNGVRRAHRESLVLIGFLPIPKAERASDNDARFRQFRRQLFHSSIAAILQSLKPGMTEPQVMRCPDGHFRRAIFSLASYIADYPEQALLACIVQGWCPKCQNRPDDLDHDWRDALPRTRKWDRTMRELWPENLLWDAFGVVGNVQPFTHDFPRADIHDMLTMDLLHQVIKGTFKDHLVAWVGNLLEKLYGKAHAARIMDEIDRRYAHTRYFHG